MALEFRREERRAVILHPASDFEPAELAFETRVDPLTGHSARILPGAGLLPRSDFDLRALADETRDGCPFCPERIEAVTPKFPPEIVPEGRVRSGEALLFPNLLPYSQYSSVSVYSPDRHYLPLAEITPQLLADNLAAQVEFARRVLAHDADARWVSVNANHMLPSGSSVFHPHLQGSVNPTPTTMQRLLAAVPAERFADYVEAERRGERFVADTGRVAWFASFAPIAPAELRAFCPSVASPADLSPDDVAELASGISTALSLYAELGYVSFNLALYGEPVNLRIACRSNLQPLYRSDATWLERLHWECATDVVPEELAALARVRFGDA